MESIVNRLTSVSFLLFPFSVLRSPFSRLPIPDFILPTSKKNKIFPKFAVVFKILLFLQQFFIQSLIKKG